MMALTRKRRPWDQTYDPDLTKRKAQRIWKRRERARKKLERLIEEKGVTEGMEEYVRQQGKNCEEEEEEEHGGIAGMEGGEQRWDRL